MEHKKIPTSAEVYAVIYARHKKELKAFSTFSAGDGDPYGFPDQGIMSTEWGIEGCDVPLIGVETRWDIKGPKRYERHNEESEYWICVGVKDDE